MKECHHGCQRLTCSTCAEEKNHYERPPSGWARGAQKARWKAYAASRQKAKKRAEYCARIGGYSAKS